MNKKIEDNKSIMLLQLSTGETITVATFEEACELFHVERRNMYYHVNEENMRTIKRRGKLYIDIDSFNTYRKKMKQSIVTI